MGGLRVNVLFLSSVILLAPVGCAFSGHKAASDGTGGISGGATGGATGSATGGSPFSFSDAAVEYITGDSSSEVGPTADANCGNTPFGVHLGPPDVLIVLDKSGSMAMDATGRNCGNNMPGCSKWDQTTAAINTVVGQSSGINWGLKLFANDNNCGVNPGAAVPVGPGTAAAIAAAIAATGPGGSTPTAAAVTTAGAYMATLTDANPKFILLATDGQPTCAGGAGNGADDAAAIKSVLDVFNGTPGFPTFVVGVATGPGPDATLSQMAVNGGHPRVANPTAAMPAYYPVSTTADLIMALDAIKGVVMASCTYPLGPPDANADQKRVTVTVDSTPSIQGDPNGWHYDPGMASITFTGTTCAQILAGTSQNVQVLYGCKVDNPI